MCCKLHGTKLYFVTLDGMPRFLLIWFCPTLDPSSARLSMNSALQPWKNINPETVMDQPLGEGCAQSAHGRDWVPTGFGQTRFFMNSGALLERRGRDAPCCSKKWCAFNRLSFDVDWLGCKGHITSRRLGWKLVVYPVPRLKSQCEAAKRGESACSPGCRFFLDVLLDTTATARPRWGPQLCHGKPLDPPPWESLRQASKNPDGCQAAHETNEMDTPQDPCICLVIKTKHVFAILLLFFRRYLYQCLWNVYTCIDMHRLFVYTVQRLSCKHDVHQGYPRCGGFNMSVVEKRVGDWRHPEPSNPQYKNTQEFQWSMFLCETM